MRNIFTSLLLLLAGLAHSQVWVVPDADKANLSIFTFDDDFVAEGRNVYNNSCLSCHGTPGAGDFTLMSPPPGDVSTPRFRTQTDGELFYKIRYGRGAMPSFAEGLSDEEIWNVVAYIRSFHPDYQQQKPAMEGVVVPVLKLALSFDPNIDMLVVAVSDSAGNPQAQATVSAYVKSMFGKYRLGNAKTNDLGLAYVAIDPSLPGDSLGQSELFVKANLGLGTAKLTQRMAVAKPTVWRSAIEGRHLWSTDRMAPIWLKILFWATIAGVWSVIGWVLLGLRKIAKAAR